MPSYFGRLLEDEQTIVLQMSQSACDALIKTGVTPTNKPGLLEKFKEACADLYVSSLIQGDYHKAMEVADRLGLD